MEMLRTWWRCATCVRVVAKARPGVSWREAGTIVVWQSMMIFCHSWNYCMWRKRGLLRVFPFLDLPRSKLPKLWEFLISWFHVIGTLGVTGVSHLLISCVRLVLLAHVYKPHYVIVTWFAPTSAISQVALAVQWSVTVFNHSGKYYM